jgi:hypothetical protein
VTRGRWLAWALVASTALGGVRAGATATAASLVLGEGEKHDAIAFGERSVTEDSFDREWRVKNPAGESLTVMTPFHRLALAAREATFRNEPMKPAEPDRVLREHGERLVFWTELRGGRPDFARFYRPELTVDQRAIKPAFVQNERTALGREGTYVARCIYGFPVKELDGKSRLSLVVRAADGRPAHAFSIDLSTMR